MVKTKNFVLNGKNVAIPNDKKLLEQIERFQKIEQYARAQEKLTIKTAEQQSRKHPDKRDFIIQADTDKYQITAINSAVPTSLLLLRGDSWDTMIQDKADNSAVIEDGAVAGLYFELLNQLKEIHK